MTSVALTSRNDDPPDRPSLVRRVGRTRLARAAGCAAGQETLGTGWRPGPRQAPQPSEPGASSLATKGKRAIACKSDASEVAVPGRPSIVPACAVVLISLIQLVPVAMNLPLSHRRSSGR